MRADAEGFALLRAALDTAGIRFAVGGSWASAAFGEPRFTRDVDILAEFTAESLDVFLCALPESFLSLAMTRMRHFAWAVHLT